MKYLLTLLHFSFAAFTSLAPLSAQAIELPKPKIEKLDNGMEIAWFLSDQLPLIDLVLIVKSGSAQDLDGKTGTAQLLSAALSKGAGQLSAQSLTQEVEKLGASYSIAATEDTVGLGIHGLAIDAHLLLDWLAKVATSATLADTEILKEKSRIDDRWNHIGDYGESLSSIAFTKLLTYGTSYARGNFNTRAEFNKITPEDTRNFYRTHFTPANSLLVVIGRVKPEEFKPQIIQALGRWKAPAETKPAPKSTQKSIISPRFKPKERTIYLVQKPKLSQAFVQMGFPAPPINSPDRYALAVANALLAEHFGSRLNSILRDKLGLTYSVESRIEYLKDFGYFTLSSATRAPTAGQLIKKTLEILQSMKSGGEAPISEEEVKNAKDYLIGSFPLAMSNLGGVATRWAFGYLHGLGPDYLNEFIPKIQAVKRAEVQNAYDAHFKIDKMIITVAGDASGIIDGAEGLKLNRFERIDLKDLN